jgi:hypothetical protein
VNNLDVSIRWQWFEARRLENAAIRRRHRIDALSLIAVTLAVIAAPVVARALALPFAALLVAYVGLAVALASVTRRLDVTTAALDRYDARWSDVEPGMPPRAVRS